VRTEGINPLQHFIERGGLEGRAPHPLFDAAWYLETYADVRNGGVNPLVHFLEKGWTEGRWPNPSFDLPWYLNFHDDVRTLGMNPLRHYVEYGADEGRPVRREQQMATLGPSTVRAIPAVDIAAYLPQDTVAPTPPSDLIVDVIVPVYRGLQEVRRCLNSVLADTDRPKGQIRVIDDCSPEAELTSWLSSLAASGVIHLTRNETNLGFVRTVNRGMAEAGRHDVLLLNSDTEVRPGFLRRLAGHAYSAPRIGTVTPFSNTGGEMCGFPDKVPRPLPAGYSVVVIDNACEAANGARSVDIPTGVGYCLYIRRTCLDEVGGFDVESFGRGYGEETDFCQRASARGWRHLLACNTFVYHVGEVSFGPNAPERLTSWNTLATRYPSLPGAMRSHLAGKPNEPAVFAATVALFRLSPLPTVLVVSHRFYHGAAAHLDDLMNQMVGAANVLALTTDEWYLELSVPSIPGHPTLRFPPTGTPDLSTFLKACSLSRVHIQHWIGMGSVLHELIDQLSVPTELTAHDYLSA
jgi:GT2 family glycosyltransferase